MLTTPSSRLVALIALTLLTVGCANVRPSGPSPTEEGSGISPSESAPPPPVFPHADDWANPASHGAWVLQFDSATCLKCHKTQSNVPEAIPTCSSCHPLFPHETGWANKDKHGHEVLTNGRGQCATQCHGTDLKGGLSGISCNLCHTTYPHTPDWVSPAVHGAAAEGNGKSLCRSCHGDDLLGEGTAVSCQQCHTIYPHEADWNEPDQHGGHVLENGTGSCTTQCHGTDLNGGLSGIGCNSCHDLYPHSEDWDDEHGPTTLSLGTSPCQACHGANLRTMVQGKNCYSCHKDYPHSSPSSWLPFTGGHGQRVQSVYSGNTSSCEACHGNDLATIKPDGNNCFSCHATYPHDKFSPTNWETYGGHGNYALLPAKKVECQFCHGVDYKGGGRSNPSCFSCHPSYPHSQPGWLRNSGDPQEHGNYVKLNSSSSCATARCHGVDFIPTPGVTNGPGCSSCHDSYPHAPGWNSGTVHGLVALADISICKDCHGNGLNQAPPGYQTCQQCHPSYLQHESAEIGVVNWDTYAGHGQYVMNDLSGDPDSCKLCHGNDYLGGLSHVSCKSCHTSFPHDAADWDTGTGHGDYVQTTLGGDLTECKGCHGNDLTGGTAGVGCTSCHANYPHSVVSGWSGSVHGSTALPPAGRDTCKGCHGADLLGGSSGVSCKSCHASFPHDAPGWIAGSGHGNYVQTTLSGNLASCKLCHGNDLAGGNSGVSCNTCHPGYPHSAQPSWSTTGHSSAALSPATRETCKACHGSDFLGGSSGVSCKSCHPSFPHNTPGWSGYSGHGTYVMTTLGNNKNSCKLCHGSDLAGGISGVSCFSCHTNYPHMAGWALPTAHGVAAYGTGKNSCASTNCHKSNFAGSPPLIPACSSCHADFPHTNPNWRNGSVGLGGNIHAMTFIVQIAGGDTTACQECHGAGYNRVVPAAPTLNCTGCHTGGVTHGTGWDGGLGHGTYFSSNYDSASASTTCNDCHGTFADFTDTPPQTKGTLAAQSTCYSCHWAYPHRGYDVPGYDPGAVGVVDADELWSVVDDNILWGPGDNAGHVYYLMRSALLTDSTGYHPGSASDPALITPSAPGVTPVLQHTCGGSTGGTCHSNGYRTTPTGSTSNLCGKYCHKP